MDKKQEQKQIAVRLNQAEIKELKLFCIENNLTITNAVKDGIELLKNVEHIETTADGYYKLKIPAETFNAICTKNR